MSKIILEDFNEGDGYYKVNLAYLSKKQVEEIEALVSKWNPTDETIKACIGMALTDVPETRFKSYGVSLKECLAWLETQNHDGKKWIYEDVYLKEKEQLIQDGIDEVLANPQKYGLVKQGEQKGLDYPHVTGWRKNYKNNKPKVRHSVLMFTTHGVAEGEWLGEEWCQYRWSFKLKDEDVLYWLHLSDLENIEKEDAEEHKLLIGEDYGVDGLYHAIRILEKTFGDVDGYQTDDGILEHKIAIDTVKALYEKKPNGWTKNDSQIKGSIVEHLVDNNLTEWANWLETQIKIYPCNDCENTNIQQNDFTPKVEPKFKVGD